MERQLKYQGMQLGVLTAAHYLADLYGGVLPSILPIVQQQFNLTLKQGLIFLSFLTLSCNVFQILTGHMRDNKKKPFFLYVGLISGAAICLIGLLPNNSLSFYVLILIAIISGFGVAVVHPEGLKAVHNLKAMPAAVGSAVFLSGGFIGFASGGYFSAHLVTSFGLEGLIFILIFTVIALIAVKMLKLELAIESDHENPLPDNKRLNFWVVFLMATPVGIASTFVISLIPTRLYEAGFDVTFGGFSAMAFGIGTMIGAYIWAAVAHRKGELKTAMIALFLGVPFLIMYLLMLKSRSAVVFLAVGGMISAATYPLFVTMARNSAGMKFGQRMGFIVGGVWGLGSVLLMLLSPIVEKVGVEKMLWLVPAGYFSAGVIAVCVYFRNRVKI